MPSRRPWLVLSLLAACAKPPPSPPPPPAASVALVASAPPAPAASVWTPRDPREIRCGLDDRPKSVISSRDLPPARSAPRLAFLSLLAKPRAPVPPPPPPPPPNPDTPNPFAPGARIQLPDIDHDPIPDVEDAIPISLVVDRLPFTLINGAPPAAPLAQALASVDPQYDACIPLERVGESLGPVTFDLELASNGSPLRVLPPAGNATPSPLVRCLMERTCQLLATASPPAQTLRVQVPLRLRRPEPEAPPPPPSTFAGRLDVATEAPDGGFAESQLQLRALVGEAARSCGPVLVRTTVRLAFSLSVGPSTTAIPRNQLIASVTPSAVSGLPPASLLACLTRSLEGRSFAVPTAINRRDRVRVTWNP